MFNDTDGQPSHEVGIQIYENAGLMRTAWQIIEKWLLQPPFGEEVTTIQNQ
jgi:hypothetical protein